MNSPAKILLTGFAAFAAGAALVFYFVKAAPKSAGDTGDAGATAPPIKLSESPTGEVIISLDAETQTRLGLKTEMPAPARWQPGIHAVGRSADPLIFTAAAADYESARTAAVVSQAELERTKKLAEENNVSPRALEAAQAAAARDALAMKSARAKFTSDWGVQLAAQTNLTEFGQRLQTDDIALVKLTPPAGTFPQPLPTAATIFLLGNETNSIETQFADDLGIDPATQTQTWWGSVGQKLPPSVVVEAQLKNTGTAADGVMVPSGAVLRYEGKGWVYVQTGTNDFTRVEIPLDRPLNGGWFDSGNLSKTNRIVITGAQTVLSAELSGGNFNSGSRD